MVSSKSANSQPSQCSTDEMRSVQPSTPQPLTSSACRARAITAGPILGHSSASKPMAALQTPPLTELDTSVYNFDPKVCSTPQLNPVFTRPQQRSAIAIPHGTPRNPLAPPIAAKLGSGSKIPIFAHKLQAANRLTPISGLALATPSAATMATAPQINPRSLSSAMGLSRAQQPQQMPQKPLEAVAELSGLNPLEPSNAASGPISINVYNVHNAQPAPPATAVHVMPTQEKQTATQLATHTTPVQHDGPQSSSTINITAPKSPLAERKTDAMDRPHIASTSQSIIDQLKSPSERITAGKENTYTRESANNFRSESSRATVNNGTYDVISRHSSKFHTRTIPEADLNEHTFPTDGVPLAEQSSRKTYTIAADSSHLMTDDENEDEPGDSNGGSSEALPADNAIPATAETTDDRDDGCSADGDQQPTETDGQSPITLDPREPLERPQQFGVQDELSGQKRPDEAELEIFNLTEKHYVSDEDQRELAEIAEDATNQPQDQHQLHNAEKAIPASKLKVYSFAE